MTKEPHVFSNILDIASKFSAFLLDAHGVFWQNNTLGASLGAKETMERLVLDGKIVGILSNTTQLPEKEKEKFKKYGINQGEHFHFFLSSGGIAKKTLLEKKLPFSSRTDTFYVFCKGHPKYTHYPTLFENSPYKETEDLQSADFVFINIPHIDGKDQIDPKLFLDTLRVIKELNKPLLCCNPDRFCHEGSPARAVVRQGTIASLYKEMGGTVFFIGKPQKEVYEHAFSEFQKHGIEKKETILMVGDTPETDILGANRFGLSSALVCETGIMKERKPLKEAISKLSLEECPQFFLREFSCVCTPSSS